MTRVRFIIGASILLLVIVVGGLMLVRDVHIDVDVVTGTTRTRTEWAWGLASDERIKSTSLDDRLRAKGIPWQPQWQQISHIQYRVFEVRRACSPGSVPLSDATLHLWADRHTDAELAAFVKVMTSGSPAAKEAAAKEVAEFVHRNF